MEGTIELTLPDNYSNVIKYTLKGITELTHNCKEKKELLKVCCTGLMVLSKDIYHIFKDLFRSLLFLFHNT